MKTLTITTREQTITRQSASFQIDIDRARGDLVATGYDEQQEKTCVVIVARGEWVDVTIDGADEPADEAVDADTGEQQRTVFVDVTPFIPDDLRERIEAASSRCTCLICTAVDRIKASGERDA